MFDDRSLGHQARPTADSERRSVLIRLLRTYLRPYKKPIALLVLLQFLQTCATLYLPTLNAHIIDMARKENLDAIHLDSGHTRFDAHRLYLNMGFKIVSHHFALQL